MTASELHARALVLVVATVLVGGGSARAEPPKTESGPKSEAGAKRAAQAHLDRGNELFTRDAYADALGEFEAAFAIFGSPKLHLNMGQCERALGHDAAAAEHFQRFLDEARDVSPALRAEAERHLAEARAAVATAQAKPIDVAAAAPPPTSPTAPLPALAPPPAALDAGPKLVAAPPPVTASRPLTKRWWFWTGLGAVAAGAGVSIFLLMRPRDPRCEASVCL